MFEKIKNAMKKETSVADNRMATMLYHSFLEEALDEVKNQAAKDLRARIDATPLLRNRLLHAALCATFHSPTIAGLKKGFFYSDDLCWSVAFIGKYGADQLNDSSWQYFNETGGSSEFRREDLQALIGLLQCIAKEFSPKFTEEDLKLEISNLKKDLKRIEQDIAEKEEELKNLA